MTGLERAEEALAECEALAAEGLGGPYVEQNLATHRARVGRLRHAEAPRSVAASTLVPAAPPPAPKRPGITISGTREERLQRLAAAMDARPETLERAMMDGTGPDAFVIIVLEDREIDTKVREILSA